MRKKQLYMTTTNSVDNGRIVENLGIVSSHLVAGTGFISDFTAGLSDFFGGRSGTYKRQLESLFVDAMTELSANARSLGSNAIIGVRIDIDNISGKGMSMFMITATGTAVKAEFESSINEAEISSEGIPWESVYLEVQNEHILDELGSNHALISSKAWEFILNNPNPSYAKGLSERFSKFSNSDHYIDSIYSEFCKNYAAYMSMLDRDSAIQHLYPLLEGANTYLYGAVLSILKDNNLFDAESVLRLLAKPPFGGSIYNLLEIKKPSYTTEDLFAMQKLLEAIENLPNVGRIESPKDGLFRGKDKFICRNEHKNSSDKEFCEVCGENIKGQTQEDLGKIKEFRLLCEALDKLLNLE